MLGAARARAELGRRGCGDGGGRRIAGAAARGDELRRPDTWRRLGGSVCRERLDAVPGRWGLVAVSFWVVKCTLSLKARGKSVSRRYPQETPVTRSHRKKITVGSAWRVVLLFLVSRHWAKLLLCGWCSGQRAHVRWDWQFQKNGSISCCRASWRRGRNETQMDRRRGSMPKLCLIEFFEHPWHFEILYQIRRSRLQSI